MKIALQYTFSILKTHKYLWFSIPLLALLLYVFFFYITQNTVLNYISSITYSSGNEQLKFAIFLASRQPFIESIALVVLLPPIHLSFMQKVNKSAFEFNLPISPASRFLSYILLAAIIYLYNLFFITGFNYLMQLYMQVNYSEIINQAYDKFGYLYTEIPRKSIINNAVVNPMLMYGGLTFFLLLPLYYIGLFYFKKHSWIKFVGILLALLTFFNFLKRMLWYNSTLMINNQTYLEYYPIVIAIVTAGMLYIALFHLLKGKEN